MAGVISWNQDGESSECGESVLFMSKFREEKKEANGKRQVLTLVQVNCCPVTG